MMTKAMTLAISLGLLASALHAQTASSDSGQAWRMPPESERCPSKWGAGDQRGTANMMTPESVVRAARLIRTGQTFELGALLSPDPKESFINAGRVFNIYTKPSPPLQNARQVNEELVVTELGQIGTQLDAFAHQMWGDSFYNCFKLGDIGTRTGFRKLGVEHVDGLMARGVLIDVAGTKGVDMLPTSYTVTPDDLRQALAKAGVKLERGDAVRPSEKPHSLPIHAMMLIQHGVYLMENLELEALAAARAYEFAFIVQPLKLKGASGSAVAPMAIR